MFKVQPVPEIARPKKGPRENWIFRRGVSKKRKNHGLANKATFPLLDYPEVPVVVGGPGAKS